MAIRYAVIARDPNMLLCEHCQDESLPDRAKESMKEYTWIPYILTAQTAVSSRRYCDAEKRNHHGQLQRVHRVHLLRYNIIWLNLRRQHKRR